jgi:hypothetical protein
MFCINPIDFPKVHIIIVICLYRSFKKHKEKITLGLIHQEYLCYCKNYRWKVIDILQVKKILEELYNSNLIHIKKDDKYINLYELKLPIDETRQYILKLEKLDYSLITSDMKSFLEDLSK